MKTILKVQNLNISEIEIPALNKSYFAAICGETGRGRFEARVPIHGIRKDKDGCPIVPAFVEYYEKDGNPRLKAIYDEVEDYSGYVYTTKEMMGFRGSMYYKFIDDVKVIAEGTHAQGDAGRMGSGQEYIIVVPKEILKEPYTILGEGYKEGRYYNNPGPRYVLYIADGGKITEVDGETLNEIEMMYEEA